MNSPKPVRQCQGSVLISAAIAASILAIVIATIFSYIGNEYYLNKRSHCWAQSLHLAEAAVEIGFAEFNNYYLAGTGFQSARGWTSLGSGSYSLIVSNYTDSLLRVAGNIEVTVLGVGTSTPWVQGVGTCPTLPRGPSISRGVKAILSGSSQFPAAIVAKGKVTLSGGAYIDSFNSTDPAKSTGGLYDFAKRQANGNVATDATIVKADTFSGGIDIYGTASTGPGGTVDMSGNATVGPTFDSSLRATTVTDGETKGYIRHDFQVSIPDVILPAGLSSALSVPGGQINQSGGTGTLSSGSWQASQLKLSGSSILNISGNVVLYVTGKIAISGSSTIAIAPNSSLAIYAADSVSVSGGGVVNNTGQAINDQWFGLPSSTSWSLSGGSAWIGTVYAPGADVTMSGNSSASGAMVGNTLTYSGTAGFHYDESLASANGGGTFILNSWQELKKVGSNWVAW